MDSLIFKDVISCFFKHLFFSFRWAMSQPLPTEGFQWVDEDINFMDVPDDAPEGFILEVDLEYPRHLHDLHSDYPLAPEKLVVAPEQLSEFQHALEEKLGIKMGTTPKLVPNLQDKTRYVVHYRNLKLYVSLGLKVTKVHRILKFKQSAWLGKYIAFNTEQRKTAKTAFEKDLFKLLNNAVSITLYNAEDMFMFIMKLRICVLFQVFGKTMENLRNRTNIDLVTKENRAKKLVACPTFHSFKVITNELVSIERRKNSIMFNRPIYIGFCILDISKTLMYSFHYTQIKEMYGERVKLLFTDTDSLCYEIETDDLYEDMASHMHHFDTSDYPVDHPLHSNVNKKVLGKMKDEMAGKVINEFIGLKPKMYSILCGQDERKTGKGIARAIIKKHIRHADYKNCVLNHQRGLAYAQKISTSNHKIQTVSYAKSTLCPLDTKRYILPDGVNTLAIGHYKIL